MADDSALLPERDLSRLRWRCRRGLLENDLFVERFLDRYSASLTQRQASGLLALMDLPDNDLLDLLLRRREPQGDLARAEVLEVLGLMRRPPPNDQREDDGPTRARGEETTLPPAATPSTSRYPHDTV